MIPTHSLSSSASRSSISRFVIKSDCFKSKLSRPIENDDVFNKRKTGIAKVHERERSGKERRIKKVVVAMNEYGNRSRCRRRIMEPLRAWGDRNTNNNQGNNRNDGTNDSQRGQKEGNTNTNNEKMSQTNNQQQQRRKRKARGKREEGTFAAFFDVDGEIISADDELFETDVFERTQFEIWTKLVSTLSKFMVFLFGVPFAVSSAVHAMCVQPWLELKFAQRETVLTRAQTETVCAGIQSFEKRLYYENLAKFPEEEDNMKFEKSKRKVIAEEAKRLEIIERTKSTKALGNWIASMIYFSVLAAILVYQKEVVSRMLRELSSQFNGLDSATQAFALLLGADMVVGYHSSDGWQAFLSFVITHYGGNYHKVEMFVRMFVATVPVFLDVCFKYWVFNKLRKISPSTQIILSEIERH
jgi:hypothetical protein